jgi:hypothetical protein
MPCPCCHHRTYHIDGKQMPYGYRRRRSCPHCHFRFTTVATDKHSPEMIQKLWRGVQLEWDSGDLFELWLTPDLPANVRLDELRRRFEMGVSREEAIKQLAKEYYDNSTD